MEDNIQQSNVGFILGNTWTEVINHHKEPNCSNLRLEQTPQ